MAIGLDEREFFVALGGRLARLSKDRRSMAVLHTLLNALTAREESGSVVPLTILRRSASAPTVTYRRAN